MVSKEKRLVRKLSPKNVERKNPIATDMFLPNHSGISTHPEAIAAFSGGGAEELNDLTDVTITAPQDEDLLQYNGSAWVDRRIGTVAGTINVADLKDTQILGIADGEVLRWDGGDLRWENNTLAEAGIAAVGDLHDAVTLAGTPNYLTLSGQEITLGTIDISDDTNLVAGTNITLAGDTLNVDDAFVLNAGDTMTGFLLMDTATEIRFRNANSFIQSTANGQLDFNCANDFVWTMASTEEMRLEPNSLTFNNGTEDTGFLWENNGELTFTVNSGKQITLFDGRLEPVIDDDVALGSVDKKWSKIFVYHDQTQPARAINTTYQNTTGHPIIVYGSIECDAAGTAGDAYFECKTDGSSPPTTVRMQAGVIALAGNRQGTFSFPFYMVVADDDYYRIQSTFAFGSTTVTLEYWNEVDF